MSETPTLSQRIVKRAGRAFWQSRPSTIFRPKRRFHLFGVGTGKSGTTSLAQIFRRHYRSGHEADSWHLLLTLLAYNAGTLSRHDLERFTIRHDRLTWLEMHSSCLNYYLIDTLVDRFPEAKFVLTIRDCYSFANSMIDHQINTPRPPPNPWPAMLDINFGAAQFKHAAEERILEERGVHTLDGYFSYWARHNAKILTAVPPERLLIVKTRDISKGLDRLSEFAGAPIDTLDSNLARGNVTVKKHKLLAQLPHDFVKDKANLYCGDLMTRFFPDVIGPAR